MIGAVCFGVLALVALAHAELGVTVMLAIGAVCCARGD